MITRLPFLFIFIIISCSLIELKAASSIRYVWAIHGLNIRSEPNSSSKKLGEIVYGDSLEIVEHTDKVLTLLYIVNGDRENNPVHLKCNWVRIQSNGISGYVINGYLLDIPTPKWKEKLNPYLDRIALKSRITKIDTNYTLRFGVVKFKSEHLFLSDDKSVSWNRSTISKPDDGLESEADYVHEEIRYFKGFTKQELLVFLNAFYGIEEGQESLFNGGSFYTSRNWKETLFLTDGGMQKIELTLFPNNVIIFYYMASC